MEVFRVHFPGGDVEDAALRQCSFDESWHIVVDIAHGGETIGDKDTPAAQ